MKKKIRQKYFSLSWETKNFGSSFFTSSLHILEKSIEASINTKSKRRTEYFFDGNSCTAHCLTITEREHLLEILFLFLGQSIV